LSRLSGRFVPDPFVLALVLTGLVGFLGAVNLVVAAAPPDKGVLVTLLLGWFGGFSGGGGLAFALQMCLVLVTGHALATSPPLQTVVEKLARIPRSAGGAAAMVAMAATISGVIHWGLGAIVGALLAREVGRAAARQRIHLHYPLLGAAAYTGLAVWHGGLSGSAPLKVAEANHFAASLIGVVPLSATLFGPLNLVVTGVLLVVIPLLCWVMAPRDPRDMTPFSQDEPEPSSQRSPAFEPGAVAAFQNSGFVGAVLGGGSLALTIAGIASDTIPFDLNSVNLLFLFAGLMMQGSLSRYVAAITEGAKGAGGIILQFPFYFGILGLMKAGGLIQTFSQAMADASTRALFPVVAFLSAGFVNLFVPSGGGQWAVQGEILLQAGQKLGVPPEVTIMAFSYGDAWTNMLQPFWALPLLGIMGLKAKDIIGYTGVVFLVMGVLVPCLLLALG